MANIFKDIIERFSSRKFLLVVFVLATIFFNEKIGLTPAQLQAMVYTVIAFITAEGIKDIRMARANTPIED